MHDVHTLMGACGSLFLLFLSEGMPFRGAIDVGVGMEINGIGFYGSAISKAYHLESTVAQYPRLVVGSDLVECLTVHTRTEGEDPRSKVSRKIAKDSLRLVVNDSTETHMLDFLNPYFRDLYKCDAVEVFEKAQDFIHSEIDRYSLCQSKEHAKLLDRYRLLEQYFDSRRSEWV